MESAGPVPYRFIQTSQCSIGARNLLEHPSVFIVCNFIAGIRQYSVFFLGYQLIIVITLKYISYSPSEVYEIMFIQKNRLGSYINYIKQMFKNFFFCENYIFLAYARQNSSSFGTFFPEIIHNFVSTLKKTCFDVFCRFKT